MKKVATLVFAILLGASLSLAQNTTGGTDQGTTKQTEGKKGHKGGKKGHKGGKKSKKGSTQSTTPPPK